MAINLLNQVKNESSIPKAEPVKTIAKVTKVDTIDSVAGQTANVGPMLTSTKLQTESDKSINNNDKQDNVEQDKKLGETYMMGASKDVNKIINRNTVAEFGFYESTNKIIIKIKDKNTNEIIKEIPSEKALQLLEKALEIAGILVDEKR